MNWFSRLRSRRLTRTRLTVLILLPALVVAFYVSQRIQRDRAWLTAVEQGRVVFEPAMAAYFTGSDDDASRALRAYLHFLESSAPSADPWEPGQHFFDAPRLAMERTVTTVRLAIVEERRANREASAQAWARAAQHAIDANVRNTDPESLRKIAIRLDEATPRPDLQ